MQKEGFAQADFSFFVQVTGNLQILLEDCPLKKKLRNRKNFRFLFHLFRKFVGSKFLEVNV
ncbi:hypothetical protein NNO21_12480, partial [Enterococcus faecium]|nr:hypothetical protein [Enterococcus faecium]MDT6773026.1 hypothetical protein [Enterococcus faecium]HBG9611912.1 hypothetical protein [Enterococcus faecium]